MRCTLMTALTCTAAWMGGCTRDFLAERLVVHTSLPGRVMLAVGPSDAALVRRGRIDQARRIAMPDGVCIDLWVIRARGVAPGPSRGTVAALHGLAMSRAEMMATAQRLADRGFDVVLGDHRGHGRSTGRYTTFGAKEARDVRRVLDVLRAEGTVASPVYAVGVSMGAATALMYAAEDPDCRGVVALAPPADTRMILRRLLAVYAPWMGGRRADAVVDRAGELADFDVDATRAADAARRLMCPVLVVHGTFDVIGPSWHGRAIYDAAAGPRRLARVHCLGHALIMAGRADWLADQVDAMAAGRFVAAEADDRRPSPPAASWASQFVFQPSRILTATPAEGRMAYEEVRFTTADGVRLHAWYIPAERGRGTVMVCHGNAGNISDRLATAAVLRRLGLSVLLFDYRGYGLSEGEPTEDGTYLDAAAAWRYLTEQRGVDPATIVVFGRSLGSAIAAHQAAETPPAALILESPFTSVVDVARHHYRLLPVEWLCPYVYPTETTLGAVQAPVLVIHSRDDEIIPFDMGRRVFEAAAEPRRFVAIRGGHNNGFIVSQELYVREMAAFLDEVLGPVGP
ncbi:MAG: alpha/beta fold hydrolase [Planctomycetes bacterium]|nr:alpha/beta fold hydrolase [Planctomycetota bacterium]